MPSYSNDFVVVWICTRKNKIYINIHLCIILIVLPSVWFSMAAQHLQNTLLLRPSSRCCGIWSALRHVSRIQLYSRKTPHNARQFHKPTCFITFFFSIVSSDLVLIDCSLPDVFLNLYIFFLWIWSPSNVLFTWHILKTFFCHFLGVDF